MGSNKLFKMKNIVIVLLLAFVFSTNGFSQDASFTQFNSAPLWYNPAFAGSIKEKRIAVLFRNQWPKLSGGGYQTVYASYDQYVKQLRGGIGFMTTYDNEFGTFRTYTNSLAYAPKIKLGEKFSISPGLKFSYHYESIDLSKLTFGDMIDSLGNITGTTSETIYNYVSLFDLASGIVLNSTSFYVGLAVEHLLEPNQSFMGGESPLPRRYVLSAAYTYLSKNKKISITPNLLWQKQDIAHMLITSTTLKYKWLLVGGGYRFGDALLAMAGTEIKGFRINYSYDYTISKLNSVTGGTGGTHEVSMRYLIK